MDWIWLSFIYGVALSMDCLSLSITDGLCFQNISKKKYFFIAGVFAMGQFLFPLVGHFIGLLGQTYISWFDDYDHWIAFVLLGFRSNTTSRIEICFISDLRSESARCAMC